MTELRDNSRRRLQLEFLALFLVMPVVCLTLKLPVIIVLMAVAAILFARARREPRLDLKSSLQLRATADAWRRMLLVWAISLPALAGLVWLLQPEEMFRLARERTAFWLAICIAYPLISVVPQEWIYRVYFFHRYRPLFGDGRLLWLASAAAFAFAHIVFGNLPAVALSFAGGWLFSRSYAGTKSLPFVAIQHSLYGCAMFTVGLGNYFFQGTIQFLEKWNAWTGQQ